MSGHVKVLACILLLKVMSSLLITNNRLSRKVFYDEQELMKTNKSFKGMPLHCCLDDPETE